MAITASFLRRVKSGASFQMGVPQTLFDHPIVGGDSGYAVTRDGQHFLLVASATEDPQAAPLTVVLNWTAGIKK